MGACLKDHSLAFWDAGDNFEFEKSFSVASMTNEYQTKIWYIEFLNLWVTTDKTNQLYTWDISQELLLNTYKCDKIRSSIIDVIPIEVLKLIGVSSMDKMITVWDFSRKVVVINIALSNAGVHSMVYSSTFQTLITAGFENMITLWNIHPVHFDYSKVGRLLGHPSMVTAVTVIEKTPMAISADDIGNIKVWDIRNLNCLQTLEMGGRTIITKLVDMYEVAKICYVGSRVNILDFDDAYDIKNKIKSEELQWPIRVEFNSSMNEFIVCTKKEVRFLDADTGRLKKVYSGLLSNNEDDITHFRMFQRNKKFILGDQRGNLGIYLYATGELLQPMNSHSNEVSSVKIDYLNRLIISSGWDSSVQIQQEIKDKFKVKRKVTNCHFKKEISIMEVSVYHNLFITAANRSNTLYLFDYEYIRLIGSIEIEEGAEPSTIQFINGYSIVVISTNIGTVHFIHFVRRDVTYIEMKQLAILDVNKKTSVIGGFGSEESQTGGANFVTKLLLDVSYDSEDVVKPEEAFLYVALSRGSVLRYQIDSIFADKDVVLIPHANSRTNYNAERITDENFEEAIKNYKLHTFSVKNSYVQHESNPGFSQKVGSTTSFANPSPGQSPLHIRLAVPENKMRSESHRKSGMVTPTSCKNKPRSGEISGQHKSESEDSVLEVSSAVLDLSKYYLFSFQAHKDVLTTLTFMHCPEKKLLTSSLDYYFRIWELDGRLLSSVNINHPLPIAWNLVTDSTKQSKKRVLYGLKIIETIFKRYERKLALSEEKKININHFLTQLEAEGSDEGLEEPPISTERKHRKLILMNDEYDPRDIQFERVKGMFQRELQGPTLRQMEITKRLMLAHKLWREQKTVSKPAPEKPQVNQESEYFHQELLGYLLGDQKAILSSLNQGPQHTMLTKRLDKKLTNSLRKPQLTVSNSQPPAKSPTGNTSTKEPKRFFERPNVLSLEKRKSSNDNQSENVTPHKKGNKTHRDSYRAEETKSGFNTHRSRSQDNLYPLWSKDSEPPKRDDAPMSNRKTEDDNLKSDSRIHAQYSLIAQKKKSLPALNFYDYANQKHLLSPEPRSLRSPVSTDVGTPGPTSVHERKNELMQILSTLERKRKKSQIIEPGITFQTIVDEKKRKEIEQMKRDLSEAKTMNSKNGGKASSETKNKQDKLPAINFNENLEIFKKNMDKMIAELIENSKESVSQQVARILAQKMKLQDPHFEYAAALQGGGRAQDFVPLGDLFQKIEVVKAVADDVVYKKQKRPPRLEGLTENTPSQKGRTPITRKLPTSKKSIGELDLETIRNKIKSGEIGD